MELYVLDELIRRTLVIDLFESLIWTERGNDEGDFELVVLASFDMRSVLTVETLVTVDDTDRVMEIQEVERTVDEYDRAILVVKGYSIESAMRNRVAKRTTGSLTADAEWTLTGTPIWICKEMFRLICIVGQLNVQDKIPFIQSGSLTVTPGSWHALPESLVWNDALGVWQDAYGNYVGDDAGDPTQQITVVVKPKSLFDAIKEICDVYNLGFRIVRNGELSQLYFEVFQGVDRTTLQDSFPPVVFSKEMDNLASSTELDSYRNAKNVAYVAAVNGFQTVYAPGTDTTMAGFKRRVLYVDASDITLPSGAALTNALNQRGYQELAKSRNVMAFDGDISQFGEYKYRRDFNLMDMVEVKNDEGRQTKMRVTEHIRVHDLQGERAYPTLVADQVVDTSVWHGQPESLEWEDAEGEWAYYEL
jgi:hypothetical protein